MQPTPIFKEQCWQYFQPSSMQIIDHQNNFDKQNYFDSQKSAFTTSQVGSGGRKAHPDCPQNRAYGSVHGSSCKPDPIVPVKPPFKLPPRHCIKTPLFKPLV